ncbi:MAG: 50S ribosomal protein L18Ae [Candidatus Anstonellales archaeon]
MGKAKYEISGYIRKLNRPFKKVVEAESEKHAKELVLCIFGSNNGLKRTLIDIKEVKKL